MKFKVFISHSYKDWSLVKIIVEILQKQKNVIPIVSMLTPPSIRHSSLNKKVKELIDKSDALIVLITHNSIKSPFVNQEIGYAIKAKKIIIPIVDEKIPPNKLGFLQGMEYIPLNRRDIILTLRKLVIWVRQFRHEKLSTQKSKDTLFSVLSVVLIGFLGWLYQKSKEE